MTNKSIHLEHQISCLTKEINGQFPRPWMTTMANPSDAQVCIVGFNQATAYDVSLFDTNDPKLAHERHLDALFNRSGMTCEALYLKMRGLSGPSETRQNLINLRKHLAHAGVGDVVVETNVVCYSTPMSEDLTEEQHRGGKVLGKKIFATLIEIIQPQVIIAHGSGTLAALNRHLYSKKLLEAHYVPFIIPLPSLAPPRWRGWRDSGDEIMSKAARQVSTVLARRPS